MQHPSPAPASPPAGALVVAGGAEVVSAVVVSVGMIVATGASSTATSPVGSTAAAAIGSGVLVEALGLAAGMTSTLTLRAEVGALLTPPPAAPALRSSGSTNP